MSCCTAYLVGGSQGGLRGRRQGQPPLGSALQQQLTGLLLQVAQRPGLRDSVQVTSQAAAPLPGHHTSHEGNAALLHAMQTVKLDIGRAWSLGHGSAYQAITIARQQRNC